MGKTMCQSTSWNLLKPFADEYVLCVMDVVETRLDQPSHFDLELELLR